MMGAKILSDTSEFYSFLTVSIAASGPRKALGVLAYNDNTKCVVTVHR
jgi:hypothetical protein